jgi:hypothetical protein
MALLIELVEDFGLTLILATHAHELAQEAGFTLLPHEIEASDTQAMTVTVQHG